MSQGPLSLREQGPARMEHYRRTEAAFSLRYEGPRRSGLPDPKRVRHDKEAELHPHHVITNAPVESRRANLAGMVPQENESADILSAALPIAPSIRNRGPDLRLVASTPRC